MHSGERGFTLVETIVALVVGGLLAAGMFRLLLDQNRFYGEVSDRSYAEETRRASADLAATELGQITSGDVIFARSDSLAVRSDVFLAYVCHVTSTDDIYLYVDRWATDPQLLGSEGTAYANPFEAGYDYDPDFAATGVASSTARDECEARGAPAGKDDDRYRLKGWGGDLEVPEPGAVLRVVRTLTYHFAPSEMSDGWALWRNGRELAAPFSGEEAGFRYLVCTSGSCSWNTTVSDDSDQRNIRRIRIEGRALGDGANRYDVALDLDYDIGLRNYIGS
ncbi:MAG: PilW family protein [Acidobacteriota bacterium]